MSTEKEDSIELANTIKQFLESKGYKVDHENKRLKAGVKRGKQITLKKAEEITKPKPKTDLQKQKEKEMKEEKAGKEKKKIREAKKEAVEQFKKGQKKKESKKPVKKPMKKEDEVRPKEKVGRPKVDPKKIKVIEPKKKSEPKEKLEAYINRMLRSQKESQKDIDNAITAGISNSGRINSPDLNKIFKSLRKGKTNYIKYLKSDKDRDKKKKKMISLSILDLLEMLPEDYDTLNDAWTQEFIGVKDRVRTTLSILDLAEKYLGIKISYSLFDKNKPYQFDNIEINFDIDKVKNKQEELMKK